MTIIIVRASRTGSAVIRSAAIISRTAEIDVGLGGGQQQVEQPATTRLLGGIHVQDKPFGARTYCTCFPSRHLQKCCATQFKMNRQTPLEDNAEPFPENRIMFIAGRVLSFVTGATQGCRNAVNFATM